MVAVCLMFAMPSIAGAAVSDPRGWHEDLLFLERELPRRHLDFFRMTTPQEFHDAVRDLDARIPRLSFPQFVVGMLKIVAMAGPGNGHTYILKTGDSTSDFFVSERNTPTAIGNLRTLGFGQLPIGFYLFKDGLYVRTSTPGYEELLGAKVLRIGSRSAEEALRAVGELVAKDNPQGIKANGPRYLAVPEILVGLDIASDPQSIVIEVETKSNKLKRELKRIALDSPATRDMRTSESAPLYLSHLRSFFWSQMIPEHATHYVQWNAVRDADGQSAKDFMLAAIEDFDRSDATKLVLDLRFNPGGNTSQTTPVLLSMIRSPKLQQRGSLFVLTGRETFSAAMNFCNALERFTPAIFVGEPTGGSPGFFGDNVAITLPHTKLEVRISNVWWQLMDSRDTRPWIPPEFAAEPTAAEFASGADPALQSVFDYAAPTDYARRIRDAAQSSAAEVLEAVRAWQADDRARYLDLENALNAAGYALLGAGKAGDSIEVLTLAVGIYPNASNLFDSLGEAYLTAGDVRNAVKNYERSLQLNPRNFNAEQQLSALRRSKQQAPPKRG